MILSRKIRNIITEYHIALDDADHPIKYYRFTKVISVNTQRLSLAPLIVSHTVSGSDVTLTIEIPTLDDGSYSYVKAVAKKGSIPASKTDGTVIDLSATATSVTFSGLDEQSHYYFVIFANDGSSDIASDPDDCTTGRNEGYNFAYTGSIQTFTAPKTGIYQLETWGAQGGNAEDSENELTARGGYGAYAKGEVLLVQGETLYIGVGGQNGFNGGADVFTEYDIDSLLKNKNLSDSSQYSIVYAEGYSDGIGNRIPNFVGTNTILGSSTGQASNFTLPTYSNNAFDLIAMLNLGYGYICIPIKPMYVNKVSFEYKIMGSGFNQEDFKALLCSDDGTSISHYDIRVAPPLTSTDWTSIEYEFTAEESAKIYTYFAIQRNSIEVQVRNIKIAGILIE